MSRKDYLGYLVLLVLHTGVAGAANIPAQTQSLSSASSSSSGFRAVATGIRMEEQPQAVYEDEHPRYLDIMIPFYVFFGLLMFALLFWIIDCCRKGLAEA